MTDLPPDYSEEVGGPDDEHDPPTTLDPVRSADPPSTTSVDPSRTGTIPPAHPGVDPPTSLDPGRTDISFDPPTTVDPSRADPAVDDRPATPWAGQLPPELEQRFALVRVVPGGAEATTATLYEVRGRTDGRVRLLRLYHPGRHPDRRLWASLERAQAQSSHLLQFEETGTASERSYELAEFIAGDTLTAALASTGPRWPPAQVTTVVRQIAEALIALHSENVKHRDVKPANVMVRCLDPIDLVLIDFGISRVTALPAEFATRSMTLAYAPPEHPSGEVSEPIDWWALGMSVVEVATGSHPFRGLDERVIMKQLATRPIDVSGVTDDRLHLLCRGLLVRNPAERWGGRQVQDWLDGGTPPVADDSDRSGGPQPLSYDRRSFVDPDVFAKHLTDRWPDSAARLTAPDSPELASIGVWLEQFSSGPEEAKRWTALTERLRTTDELGDVRLLRLLRHVGPTLPPVYRLAPMTRTDVVAVANAVFTRAGAAPADADRNISDLWQFRLLPAMAGGPDGIDLVEVDQRWRALTEEWLALLDRLHGSDPAIHNRLVDTPPTVVRAGLLYLAAGGAAVEEQLRATVESRREEFAGLPWFGLLADLPPGPSGLRLGLLAATLLIPVAELAVQRAARLAATQRERDEAALKYDAIDEWFRYEDRFTALGWAAAGVMIVVGFWVALITVSDVLPYSTPEYIADAWATAFVSILVVFGGEVSLAAMIGGPYAIRARPPDENSDPDELDEDVDVDERPTGLLANAGYSLVGLLAAAAGGVGRAALGVAGRRREYGGLRFLALVAGALLVGVTLTLRLPFLLPLTTCVVHLGWTAVRVRRWLRERVEREASLARARERWLAVNDDGLQRQPSS